MLPDRSVLIGQKLVENAKMPKIQMRPFGGFSNNVQNKNLKIKCVEAAVISSVTYHRKF